MRFLIISAACALLCGAQHSSNIWRAHDLSSVVHFGDIEDYYMSRRAQAFPFEQAFLRTQVPPTEPLDVEERKWLKKAICKSILTSYFFRMHQIEWIDVDLPEIQQDLRNNHRIIFNSIYTEIRVPPLPGFVCVYENFYRERRIQIHNVEEVGEDVFNCLARDPNKSGAIKEYFVSRVYNVNVPSEGTRTRRIPIAGRFIFTPDETDNNMLTMVAMAEETALGFEIIRTSGLVTLGYIWNRYREGPTAGADTPDQDPVCSLTPAHKLRLCSLVLSQPTFQNKLTFLPVNDSVQPDCERKAVSIALLNRFFTHPYEEWVTGCKARMNNTNETVTYYVSRARYANSVFVYIDAGDEMISLYNFYICVSVVDSISANANDLVPQDEDNELQRIVLLFEPRAEDTTAPLPGVRFLYDEVED